MTFNVSDDFGGVVALFAIVSVLLTAIVHIAFALAVLRDANRMTAAGTDPAFVHPAVWGMATLLGGVVPAALYWAIHHWRLRREPPPRPD